MATTVQTSSSIKLGTGQAVQTIVALDGTRNNAIGVVTASDEYMILSVYIANASGSPASLNIGSAAQTSVTAISNNTISYTTVADGAQTQFILYIPPSTTLYAGGGLGVSANTPVTISGVRFKTSTPA